MERKTSTNPLTPGEIAKATSREVTAELYLSNLFETQYVSNEMQDDGTLLEALTEVTVVPEKGLFSDDVAAVELRISRETAQESGTRSNLNHIEVTTVFNDGQKAFMYRLSSSLMNYNWHDQAGWLGPDCTPSYSDESEAERSRYADKAEMFSSLVQSAWLELDSPGLSPSGNS